MDLDYFVAPVVFLLIGVLVAWRAVIHLRTLPTRFPGKGFRLVDQVILGLMLAGAAVLTVCATYNALSLLRFREMNRPASGMYVVNGHRMHLNCAGAGSPTLVLEAGLGNDSLIWGSVQPEFAKTTRVCSYDRAGFGWSDPVDGPRDADHIAVELHALLAEADIHGPIVLMGHSVAGMYIRDYATRYPEQVAGLIFLDGSTPLQDENPVFKDAGEAGLPRWASILVMRTVDAAGLPRLAGRCGHSMHGFDAHASELLAEDLCHPQFNAIDEELRGFHASGLESAHTGPFGDLPVLIISQDPAALTSNPHTAHALVEMERVWGQMQENLKHLSTRSRRIIARGSSHAVQVDRPDLLAREVPLFLEQIRGTAPQPAEFGTTVTE